MTVHSPQRRPDEGAGSATATSLQESATVRDRSTATSLQESDTVRDRSDVLRVRSPRHRTSIRHSWVHADITRQPDTTERRAA